MSLVLRSELPSWASHPEVQHILRFVLAYREKYHIVPKPGRKLELSCIAFGEFHNLLFCQLITTPEFTEGWQELANEEIRCGVLREVESLAV